MGDQGRKVTAPLVVAVGVEIGDGEELLRQGLTGGCWETV